MSDKDLRVVRNLRQKGTLPSLKQAFLDGVNAGKKLLRNNLASSPALQKGFDTLNEVLTQLTGCTLASGEIGKKTSTGTLDNIVTQEQTRITVLYMGKPLAVFNLTDTQGRHEDHLIGNQSAIIDQFKFSNRNALSKIDALFLDFDNGRDSHKGGHMGQYNDEATLYTLGTLVSFGIEVEKQKASRDLFAFLKKTALRKDFRNER